MKKRWMALVLCGVMLMPGCGKTEQGAPAEAEKEAAAATDPAPEATEAETTPADTEEKETVAAFGKDEVLAMINAMCEQMEADPARITGTYMVSEDYGCIKQYEVLIGQNDGISYWRAETPSARAEVYAENDGKLYVDISEDTEFEDVTESENLYFDGSRYHLLQKAESGAVDYSDMTASMTEVPEYLDALDLVVIGQETAGEYTLVSCAAYAEIEGGQPTESHIVLCVKDGVADGFITGHKITSTSLETGEPVDEYYFDEIVLGADAPAEIPSYFDDIEYGDAEEVGQSAAWGIMGVMFAGSESLGEEWTYGGILSSDNADVICELLDADTEYFELPEPEVIYEDFEDYEDSEDSED